MSHETQTFQAPAILSSISYTKDGGVRVGFITNELSPTDKLIITEFHNKFGYVLFSSGEFGGSDVPPDPPKRDKDSWSPSKRLRYAIYKEWQTSGQGDFEEYYERKIGQLIRYIEED